MLGFLRSKFEKVKKGLSKTRAVLGARLKALFGKPWEDEALEQILFEADLGTECALDFVETIRKFLLKEPNSSSEEILTFIKKEALAIFSASPHVQPKSGFPEIIFILGVNGSGKTTSCAKLAKSLKDQGKKVLLVAADTFRAAAVEQLDTWAKRIGVDIVKGQMKSDPAAVVFDGVSAAVSRGVDVVIIDTAGRLENKEHLMRELSKMHKTAERHVPGAPHKTLLVLDATTGQNALDQVKTFHQITPLTGIILTKLDGSAKGGIALGIYKKYGIPIDYIGVGEAEEDFLPFDKESYIEALFS